MKTYTVTIDRLRDWFSFEFATLLEDPAFSFGRVFYAGDEHTVAVPITDNRNAIITYTSTKAYLVDNQGQSQTTTVSVGNERLLDLLQHGNFQLRITKQDDEWFLLDGFTEAEYKFVRGL